MGVRWCWCPATAQRNHVWGSPEMQHSRLERLFIGTKRLDDDLKTLLGLTTEKSEEGSIRNSRTTVQDLRLFESMNPKRRFAQSRRRDSSRHSCTESRSSRG